MLNHIHVIAHRGASAYAPENTLASFKRAEVLGAGCIEFDVQLTADKALVVFHDETLRRTTNGRGDLIKTTSEQLSQLDAGSWFSRQFKGEPVLSFKDALLWFSTRAIKANIEIKAAASHIEQTTLAVLREINRHWPTSKALPIVSSFEIKALRICAHLMPDLPKALLLSAWRDDCVALAKELGCKGINLSRRIVTPERVKTIKDAGFIVCVYTVNRRRDARRYLQWGVDAVFSDYPDLLIKLSYLGAITQAARRFFNKVFKKIWIKLPESPKIIR